MDLFGKEVLMYVYRHSCFAMRDPCFRVKRTSLFLVRKEIETGQWIRRASAVQWSLQLQSLFLPSSLRLLHHVRSLRNRESLWNYIFDDNSIIRV